MDHVLFDGLAPLSHTLGSHKQTPGAHALFSTPTCDVNQYVALSPTTLCPNLTHTYILPGLQ